MADAARSKPVVAAEFAQSARNGVAIQAGDTRHQGDATIPLLLGQQGDQLATTMLISPSDQSVDGAMVLCRDAVRMLSAGRAHAAVQFHRGVLLFSLLFGVPPLVPCGKRTLLLPFYQNLLK